MPTKFDNGVSLLDDSREAAREAVENAGGAFDPEDADFVTLFVANSFNLEEVVGTVRELTDNATLIGASTAGEFTEDGPTQDSVTVALVKSDEMEFYSAMGRGLKDDIDSAIEEATSELPTEVDGYPHKVGINLHDGLTGRGEEIALMTYNKLPMPYTGGSAGDGLEFEEPWVFSNDEVATDAIAVGMIASKKPFVQSVGHGHKSVEGPFRVTEAEGSVVKELDGRPAFEVYAENVKPYVEKYYEEDFDEVSHDKLIGDIMVRFEMGIKTGDDYKIRWPGLTPDREGPLHFATKIPEGVDLYLMDSDLEDQFNGAKQTSEKAVARAAGNEMSGALIFDCACQSIIMGGDFERSIEIISDVLEMPLVGMETYGEVCIEPEDMRAFHNTTSSILLLPK